MLAMGFSGYLMPWDELAFFATKVGTRIAGSLPAIGQLQMKLLRGGEEVTGVTLSRFYALHVVIFPMALAALVGVHLVLIQTLGLSTPPSIEAKREQVRATPFFTDFLLLDGMFWTALLGIIVTLAVLSPAGIGVRADPLRPAPDGVQPEWYFLFMFETLKRLPAHVLGLEGEMLGVVAFTLAGILFLFVPFIAATARRERALTWVTVAAILYVVVGTAVALLSARALGENEVVAKMNKLTPIRVIGLVWAWTVCLWVIVALFLKWRYRRWLWQVGYLKMQKERNQVS
jgi:cytochrome b6